MGSLARRGLVCALNDICAENKLFWEICVWGIDKYVWEIRFR